VVQVKYNRVLITGGTGSFGQYMTKYLINTGNYYVRIFSRDERKHGNNLSLRQSNKIKEVFDCGYFWYKQTPEKFKKKVGLLDAQMYLVNRFRLLKSLVIYYKSKGVDK
jgi:hypothetical protein